MFKFKGLGAIVALIIGVLNVDVANSSSKQQQEEDRLWAADKLDKIASPKGKVFTEHVKNEQALLAELDATEAREKAAKDRIKGKK